MNAPSIPALSIPTTSITLTQRVWTITTRLATAVSAVIGLSAMAVQGAVTSPLTFEDGIYLFGDSPVAETLGAVYFVFQVKDQALSGAVYQPSSSFDCVHGTVEESRLDLTVIDAYNQTEHPYSLAVVPGDAAIADVQGIASVPQLEGMHQIHELSELEHRLLETCAL